jgi:hypothetical protein
MLLRMRLNQSYRPFNNRQDGLVVHRFLLSPEREKAFQKNIKPVDLVSDHFNLIMHTRVIFQPARNDSNRQSNAV